MSDPDSGKSGKGLSLNLPDFGGWAGRIRLGSGLVGRMSSVAMVALLVLGAIAFKMTGDGALLILTGVVGALFVVYLIAALVYGFFNPAAALLTSADFVKHSERVVGGKDVQQLVNVTPVPNPALTSDLTDAKDDDDA